MKSTQDFGMREGGPLAVLEGALTHRAGAKITLEELRVAMGERSFGFLLIVACVPGLIPIPAVGSIIGFIPLMLGAMLVMGRSTPWLPGFVLHKPILQKYFHSFLAYAKPWWARGEKLVHPRLGFVFSPVGERVMGVIIMMLAAFIIFPGPLTNLLPSLALTILGLAVVEKDGLLALGAYLFGAAVMVFLTLLYGGLLYSGYVALQKMFGV